METQETHNASIYHCVTCGRVEHVELDAKTPQCCGKAMAKAFTETIPPVDFAPEVGKGDSETAMPVITDKKKPR